MELLQVLLIVKNLKTNFRYELIVIFMPRIVLVFLLLTICYCEFFLFPERVTVNQGQCVGFTFECQDLSGNRIVTFSPTVDGRLTLDRQTIDISMAEAPQYYPIKLCAASNMDEGSFIFTYYITSPNDLITQSGRNYINVTVTKKMQPTLDQPITLRDYTIGRKCFEILLTTPGPGFLHFTAMAIGSKANPPTDPIQMKKIDPLYWGFYNTTIYSNLSTRLSNNYASGIVGSMAVSGNYSSKIELFNDLMDRTNYNICYAYESADTGAFTNLNCMSLPTDDTEPNMLAFFNFTHRITLTKLNYLLCYLVALTQSYTANILTLDGLSCNLISNRPSNYYYNYTGRTYRPSNSTIVFFTQSCNLTKNVNLLVILGGLWNSDMELKANATRQLRQNGVFWVENGRSMGWRIAGDMMNRTGVSNTTISYGEMAAGEGGRWVITGLNMTNVGIGYFVLVNNKTSKDALRKPTPDMVLNCKNNISEEAEDCVRVVFSDLSVNVTLNFTPIAPDKYTYKVFYVASAEYPMFPILSSDTYEATFNNTQKTDKKATVSSSNPTRQGKEGERAIWSILFTTLVLWLGTM